ncbi:MAG: hypothetical protein AB7Y46_20120, partial [Armatimonadota bacterium]
MHLRRCLLLTAIALLLGSCAPAPAEDIIEGIGRLFKDWGLFQGMQITGSNTLTLQEHALVGSRSAFEGQRWDTGTLVRRSSIHVEGPIWRDLGIQADLSYSGWGRSYSRYILGWTTDTTAVYYGDLNIRLTGNEFAGFSKTLQGWQVDQMLPSGGLLRAFYSKERGLTRRETISGNNTTGPFFLRYTPIIEGSEVVKVDEEVMRFGRDYRLDYETGQLWFEPVDGPPRIIPSTSVVLVSYQSYGWESSPGALCGARAEMPMLDDKMVVGLTALRQDRRSAQNAGDTAGYQEDIFQASGTTGPFDVNFRPILPNGATVIFEGQRRTIDQTVVVLADNVEQVQGVDYDVYHDIGRILFRRAVPPTALVIVRYYYDLGEPAEGGDTQLVGLDLGYRITPGLTLRADWAQSDRQVGSASGQAMRTSLAYSRPNLTATLELRDVQPGFSYLDTVGFQRKERGLNLAAEWQATDYISVYERFSDLSSDTGLSFGYSGYSGYTTDFSSLAVSPAATTSTGLDVNTRRNDLGIDVRYPGWPTLSYTRQDWENSGGTRGDSRRSTDALSLDYSPRELPFSVRMSLNGTNQRYLGLASGETASGSSGSSTDQFQLSATYTPTSSLSLAGHFGTNSSTSLGASDRSTGTVMQLSARWAPSSRLNLNLDIARSESEGLVSSGFYSTIGTYGVMAPAQLPDNPGGGDGDDGDGEPAESTRYADSTANASLVFRPTDSTNLTLSAGLREYRSGGGIGYLADSKQTYYNATAGWQPSRALSLTATWGTDEMRFLEEGRGSVLNDMLALSLSWRPPQQPWGLALNLHRQTGSSPTYVGFGANQIMRIVPTDLFDLSGELSYQLRPGISLFGRLGRADYDSGYAVFTKDTGEIGVRYDTGDFADVNFGYRYIRNITGDPDLPLPGSAVGSTASQNYIAHSFMFELATSFNTGLSGGGTGGYSGYGGGLASFGGYGAGYGSGYGYGYGQELGYDYRTGGIGDFSGMGSYRRAASTTDWGNGYDFGLSPFGGTTTGSRMQDFSTGADDTRGSTALYRQPALTG